MKIIEVIADPGSTDTILAIAEKASTRDVRGGVVDDKGMQSTRMVVGDDNVQHALDLLQNTLGAQPAAQILVIPLDSALPRPKQEQDEAGGGKASRESLYEGISKVAFAYLMDVFVLAAYRGRGLGQRLVKNVVEHPELQVKFWLLGTHTAHELYRQLGFSDLDRPDRYMAIKDDSRC